MNVVDIYACTLHGSFSVTRVAVPATQVICPFTDMYIGQQCGRIANWIGQREVR